MKVYRVEADVNSFQWIMPEVPDSDLVKFRFDCTERVGSWEPPRVFVFDPLKEKGDFLHFGSDTLLASPRAATITRTFFDAAGESLPLFYDNERYTLLNILECINVLDHDTSEKDIWIRKYCFLADKFGRSSLFKIPEETVSVLTLERDCNSQQEFKACVEANGLTGLIFEELWDSEKE